MAKSAVGFGMIGCGMIANFHARAVGDLRGAKGRGLLRCGASGGRPVCRGARLPGLSRSQADAGRSGGRRGHDRHAQRSASEPAVAAARAGKHVIVEKPLEITLGRCDRIIRECEKSKVKCSAIFPSRFHHSSIELKRAVEAGRFGRLTLAEAYVKWYRTQAYYDSGAWRGTWELDGGGALMNQAIHSVDLLTWLMGPVVEITAHTAVLAHERIAVEDTAVATLKFANGARGVIEASDAAYPGYLKRIEIHGSTGGAAMEEEDVLAWDFARKARAIGGAGADGRADQHGRRGQRSLGHRSPRPYRTVSRRAGRDPRRSHAGHRRCRGPPFGRNHPGHLQSGRDGQSREVTVGQRPRAGGSQKKA